MWRAAASIGGAWEELEVVELGPAPFSSAALRDLVRERFPNASLLRHLDQEADSSGGDAARDAIESWAVSAAAAAREFDWDGPARVEAIEETLALYRNDAATSAPAPASTLAWHDRTAVVIALTGDEEQVVVDYVPELRDAIRVDRLRDRHATSAHRLETILDWRGYFGRDSAVIDGWTAMRARGHGFVAAIEGTVGFVVGTVLRRLTRDPPTFARDPTARGRRVTMADRHREIARACPDLATVSRATHNRAMVFVHGTVSCGIQGLKDLYPALAPPPATGGPAVPIYRYEHDTFLPLEENAAELARLIEERLDVARLLVVAHSRGGLVARLALAHLRRDAHPAEVSLYTFGTPHEGTPLVALGSHALNLLYRLGEGVTGAIPVLSPLTRAYAYLLDAPVLPRGIEAMRPGSDAFAMLRLVGDPGAVRAWGSEFDVQRSPSGFGVAVEGALLGGFADRRHDLVVPSASALAFGAPQPLLGCSHVHYFAQPSVQAAIRGSGLFPVPEPEANLPLPSPAGSE